MPLIIFLPAYPYTICSKFGRSQWSKWTKKPALSFSPPIRSIFACQKCGTINRAPLYNDYSEQGYLAGDVVQGHNFKNALNYNDGFRFYLLLEATQPRECKGVTSKVMSIALRYYFAFRTMMFIIMLVLWLTSHLQILLVCQLSF